MQQQEEEESLRRDISMVVQGLQRLLEQRWELEVSPSNHSTSALSAIGCPHQAGTMCCTQLFLLSFFKTGVIRHLEEKRREKEACNPSSAGSVQTKK